MTRLSNVRHTSGLEFTKHLQAECRRNFWEILTLHPVSFLSGFYCLNFSFAQLNYKCFIFVFFIIIIPAGCVSSSCSWTNLRCCVNTVLMFSSHTLRCAEKLWLLPSAFYSCKSDPVVPAWAEALPYKTAIENQIINNSMACAVGQAGQSFLNKKL